MNREEYFHNDISRIDFNRTRFDMPFQHQTAFNVGDIVPLMAEPIYPGDSVKSKVAYLVRSFTPINQIFSNLYLDVYCFFEPLRLTWVHFQNFLGENDSTAWTSSTSYTIPQMVWSSAATASGDYGTPQYFSSFGGYLGINFTNTATGSGGVITSYSVTVSDLWRRGYLHIYNEWFRAESVIAPILYSVGDNPEVAPVYTYASPLLKAAKFHDYFTTVSPQAQFGDPVVLGSDLPVTTGNSIPGSLLGTAQRFKKIDGSSMSYSTGYDLYAYAGTPAPDAALKGKSGTSYAGADLNLQPSNLWAKMTITIEDLRKSIALQHLTEKLAQSGSRYPEFLKGIWSVTSSDARLQIPEYLGGKRFPIHVSEVVSTADTVSSANGQPLGSTGAMIKDGNVGELFNKAFTEYGQLWILGVVRVEQTYFQGLARKFTDSVFGDFYNPYVANLGNQPRYTREIYSLVTNQNTVLGFGPAWDHLRYTPYLATSIMRPDLQAGLQSWSAAEVYSGAPTLNQAFIEQPASGFDRTLAVPSTARNAFQFFGEFKFMNTWTRVLPAYPSPGLARI